MAKGEDALRRKRNKSQRKKLRNETSLSARVASIIAAKRRRKAGKRRICEGMCFSLPTPEDPFNDRNSKKAFQDKLSKKFMNSPIDAIMATTNEAVAADKKSSPGDNLQMVDKPLPKRVKVSILEDGQKTTVDSLKKYHTMAEGLGNLKVVKLKEYRVVHAQNRLNGSTNGLSKFLILCLNAIQNTWKNDAFTSMRDHLLANPWGIDFWKFCSAGLNILETSGACSSREQIAWIVSIAADVIATKEEDDQIVGCPYLLFIVPSQDKAMKVRTVCKPLKALGIHTVSLHSGASIDRQIQGMKSCEPEFIVSTPERLLELVSLKAVDISCVSLLVLDGLENFFDDELIETIKSIKQCISGEPQMVIFGDCYGKQIVSLLRDLVRQPVCRLSLVNSITAQSAFISQCVHLYTSSGENVSKSIQILLDMCHKRMHPWLLKALLITGSTDDAQELTSSLRSKGFNISDVNSADHSPETSRQIIHPSKKRAAVSVINAARLCTCENIEDFEAVIFIDLPSISDYIQVLTEMARHSIDGELHAFLREADFASAGPLIKVLEQCSQPIPEALKTFHEASL